MIMIPALEAKDSRHVILRHHANAARASSVFPGWGLRSIARTVILRCLSRVWIGGLDDNDRVEKILGLEYASVFLNEASQIPYPTALIAFTRLAEVARGIRQHAFVDLNPAGKSHWTNVLFGEHRDPVSMQPLKEPENYRRAKSLVTDGSIGPISANGCMTISLAPNAESEPRHFRRIHARARLVSTEQYPCRRYCKGKHRSFSLAVGAITANGRKRLVLRLPTS
jgi:hypothetical protein